MTAQRLPISLMRTFGITFLAALARIGRVIRRVIGAPDYERYVAHHRRCHLNELPLSREAFAKDALARRYNQPGNRCC